MRDGVGAYAAGDRGSLIGPDDWKGLVQSVHANVVNILREDGLVLSLIADPEAMTAMGVLVPRLFVAPLPDSTAGRAAESRAGIIAIDGVAKIDVSRSRSWSGTLDEAAVRCVPAPRVRQMHAAVVAHGRTGGLLGVLEGKPGNPFVDAARAALSHGRPDALVGLGPGMTPAGDDFLTGALMASWVPQGRDRIEAALPGTSPGGRTLLWMALRGSFPAYLGAFVQSIARVATLRDIESSVRAACSHGETSGTDTLTGFCWALERKPPA